MGWQSVLAVILGSAAMSAAWLGLWQRFSEIYIEHGPMENFQLSLLLISLVVTGHKWFKASDAPLRTALLALGMLHLTFVLHEFDPRQFGNSTLTFLLHGLFRNTFLVLLWTVVAFLFVIRLRPVIEVVARWLSTPSGAMLQISGAFWLMGGFFDKVTPFSRESSMMAEELMECNGALFMLVAMLCLSVPQLKPVTRST